MKSHLSGLHLGQLFLEMEPTFICMGLSILDPFVNNIVCDFLWITVHLRDVNQGFKANVAIEKKKGKKKA